MSRRNTWKIAWGNATKASPAVFRARDEKTKEWSLLPHDQVLLICVLLPGNARVVNGDLGFSPVNITKLRQDSNVVSDITAEPLEYYYALLDTTAKGTLRRGTVCSTPIVGSGLEREIDQSVCVEGAEMQERSVPRSVLRVCETHVARDP
jgi:hypothetical protein